MRRALLTLLPKVALSRLTGLLARTPLPRSWRGPLFRAFARRYDADLTEIEGELASFRSLAQFFQRPLRAGARPLATAPLLWPCDGRIVAAGSLGTGRRTRVKGFDYELADLLGDQDLAAGLQGGSEVTIYLAPGDYHRVHAPFAATVETIAALPGTLFPVNPPAMRCIPRLFARNARHVLHCRLDDGRRAAVVLVGAFNVGDTAILTRAGERLSAGQELGCFGFGSTVVVLLAAGMPAFAAVPAGTRVRMGGAAVVASGAATVKPQG